MCRNSLHHFAFNRRRGGRGGEAVVPLEVSIASFREGQSHGFDPFLREVFFIKSLLAHIVFQSLF